MRPEDILRVVSTSFGPCGSKKMCVDHGGKAVITNEGAEILSKTEEREQIRGRTSSGASANTSTGDRERLSHYLVKMTQDSCRKHSLTTGDGSIHLAILVLTGLSKLQRLCRTKEGNTRLILLKHNFQLLVDKFEEILQECLQVAGQRMEVTDAIFNLAFTKFACKCSPRVGKALTSLVVALLSPDHSRREDLPFYTQYNPAICISDHLVHQSQVLPGICLSLSANSVRKPRRQPFVSGEACLKFVAVNCLLDDFDCSGLDSSVRVQSSNDYARVTNSYESLTFRRMQMLKSKCGVNAVISTQKFGDIVKLFGQQLEIDLLFCPEEDEVRRLCFAFEIPVLDDLAALSQDERNGNKDPLSDHDKVTSWIGEAKDIKILAKGSALILQVTLPETSCNRKLQSIVLCAPSYASCKQYSRLLNEALVVVAQTLESNVSDDGGVEIIPGACLIEKLVLIEIANILTHQQASSLHSSLCFGLEILQEMVRAPAVALGENMIGKDDTRVWKQFLHAMRDPAHEAFALNLLGGGQSEDSCRGILSDKTIGFTSVTRRRCVQNPVDIGVVHSHRYYGQMYRLALQLFYQMLRLVPTTQVGPP